MAAPGPSTALHSDLCLEEMRRTPCNLRVCPSFMVTKFTIVQQAPANSRHDERRHVHLNLAADLIRRENQPPINTTLRQSFHMYHHTVVSLSAANPGDQLRALDEVRDFATTSMGRSGPHRWTYRMLSEPRLTQELRSLSHPRSVEGVDGITFQPCQLYEERSQDRCRIEHWPLSFGTWVFTAIFDGASNLNLRAYLSH